MKQSDTYRTDLDGIRAIAVIFVVIFHSNIGIFPGGFIGVDIFFVISGYLISGKILIDLKNNTFSLSKFYLNRFLRIYPALVFVVLSTIPFAFLWMNYAQIKQYAGSIVSTIFAMSNFYFWRISGYFDTESSEKILLHTWSLGVEEQFYFIFPIFLMILHKSLRKNSIVVIALLLFVSLSSAEYFSDTASSANFYMLPTRAWEFLAGALCTYIRWQPQAVTASWVSMGSLIVILTYGLFLPPSALFPSLLAAPFIIATVLIIVTGKVANVGAHLLSFRPLVVTGLSSYSIYLWHQPLFAFARLRSIEPLDTLRIVLLCLAAVGLGVLTWRFVERPFRASPQGYLKSTRARALGVGLVGFAIATFGLVAYSKDGFAGQSRIPLPVMADLQVRAMQDSCYDFRRNDIADPQDWYCKLNVQLSARSVAIIGDSHALSYISPLSDALKVRRIGVAASSISGCPPLRNTNVIRGDDIMMDCNARNRIAFSPAALEDVSLVILIARWSYYSTGDITGQFQPIEDVKHGNASNDRHGITVFENNLQKTIDYLLRSGLPVIIILQPPVQNIEPSKIYSAAFLFGSKPAETLENLSLNHIEHIINSSSINKVVRSSSNGSVVIDISSVLCSTNCMVGTVKRSYFYDRNHLSNYGATLVVPRIVQEVERLLCARQTGVMTSAPPAGRCPS